MAATSTAESPQPNAVEQGTKEWTEFIRTSELEETEAEPDMSHAKELVMALMVYWERLKAAHLNKYEDPDHNELSVPVKFMWRRTCSSQQTMMAKDAAKKGIIVGSQTPMGPRSSRWKREILGAPPGVTRGKRGSQSSHAQPP